MQYNKQSGLATPGNTLYTLLLALVCWVVCCICSVGFPVYGEGSASPLWKKIGTLLTNKTATYLLGMVLTAGGAFLIHRANYALMIIREKTHLPFLLYILLISTHPGFLPIRSTSIGVFCLILSLYQLFKSYHDRTSVGQAFNAALAIGVGSLFWVHILWFLPLFWIGMYNFKALSIRTFAASLVGAGTVYWFLLGWCVWQHDFTPFAVWFHSLFTFGLFMADLALVDWISIGYIGVLTVTSAVNIILHENDDNLRTRQFLSFIICLAVLSFLLFFVYESSSEEFLAIACMPSALLLAHYFTVQRTKWHYWLYHFTQLVLVLFLFIRLWNSLSSMAI